VDGFSIIPTRPSLQVSGNTEIPVQRQNMKFKASYFFFLLMFLSCRRKGEDCIYLIPKNFEGNLLILFNQEKGAEKILGLKATTLEARMKKLGIVREKQ